MSKYYEPVIKAIRDISNKLNMEFRLDPLTNSLYNLSVKHSKGHKTLLTHTKLKNILKCLEFFEDLYYHWVHEKLDIETKTITFEAKNYVLRPVGNSVKRKY